MASVKQDTQRRFFNSKTHLTRTQGLVQTLDVYVINIRRHILILGDIQYVPEGAGRD